MTGRMACRLSCLCGESWTWAPNTRSAVDMDVEILAHIKAHADDEVHSLGAIRHYWSEQEWEPMQAVDPAEYDFHQVFTCQGHCGVPCASNYTLDCGEDVSDEEAAEVDIHRALTGHNVVVIAKSVKREA